MKTILTCLNAWLPELRRSVWLAALAVGVVFLITEHNAFISLAQDYTQDEEAMLQTAAGGNMLRRVAFLAMAAAGIGLYVTSSVRKIRWTLLGGLMLAMIALAFSSVLWTHDLGLCLRRLFAFGLSLVGLFGVARNFNLKELCWIALLVSLSCALLGLGCELALGTFRPWSGEYRFSGTVHPNTQGAYLATLCFAAVCLSVVDAPRRYWYWGIVALGVGLLVLSKSRTSTMGVLASLGLVVLVLSSNRTRFLVLAAGTFAAIAGLLLLLLSGADPDALLAKIAFMGRQEDTESFSGRTTIWPVVEQYIGKSFWLGYGFESFWTPAVIEDVSEQCEWGVREAHSAYRDMLLSLGAVGLALYCTIVIVGVVMAAIEYHAHREVCALFWIGMALNGFFNGLFESGMMLVSFPTFMIAAGFLRLALFQPAVGTCPEANKVAWQPHLYPSPAYGIQP
jgi:exopolysaccharide production protein ExoQ